MSTGYNQGDQVIVDATFTADGTDTDPTTVVFNVREPDMTVLTYTYGEDTNVTRVSTGVYQCDLGVPAQTGEYRYDAVGTGTVNVTLPGTFYVFQNVTVPPSSPPPGPFFGPSVTWITGQDVAQCCAVNYGDNPSVLDSVAYEASSFLYEYSGRLFAGMQTAHVRPMNQACGCSWASGLGPWAWGPTPYLGGYAFGGAYGGYGWGWWNASGVQIGCTGLSRVKLAGYPIRSITQVKINGEVLDPDCYRLDEYRYLTRMSIPGDDPPGTYIQAFWPGCQAMDLNDNQPGTFSVDYVWGADPPPVARRAACQLACQLYIACIGDGSGCVLPAGVTKIDRQGVSVSRQLLADYFSDTGTGLVALDTFLAGYCRSRAKMRSAVFSPDVQQYSRPFANTDGDADCTSTLGMGDWGV